MQMVARGRIPKLNPGQDVASSVSTVARHGSSATWLLARAIVAAVFLGFCLIGLLGAFRTPRDPAETALGVICLVILLAIQLLYFARPEVKLRTPVSYAVLGLQAVLVYLPMLLFGDEWAVLPGFLAGSALFVLPWVAAWLVFVAVVASVPLLQLRLDAVSPMLKETTIAHEVILYSTIGTVITGLVLYGLTRFASLVSDLHATDTELAHLAVEHERVTIAGDLNDLLGRSLSEITLRGELAHRLLLQAPARAGAELERILYIARGALADIRSIANRYSRFSVDQETRSVAATPDAASPKARVDIDNTVFLPAEPQLRAEPAIPEPSADAGTGSGQHVEGLHRRLPVRSTRGLVTTVFAGFFLIASVRVVPSGQHPIQVICTVGCMAALLGVQLLFVYRPAATLGRPIGRVLLAVQAVLVPLPMLWSGMDWVSLPGFVAGSALLIFRPLVGWVLFASVLVEVAALKFSIGASTDEVVFIVVATINSGLATWGLIQLANLVADLHGARSELARAAVIGERLRFARDVHDLLGLSLSALALKGELANRLLRSNLNGAAVEVCQMLDISRSALAEIRSVASGESLLPLERECASVESALTAADVKVRIALDHSDLSAPLETVLAAVLREGATNMLRHSDVANCEITLVKLDTTARLEMVNDGVPDVNERDGPTSRQPANLGGNGLRNLAERVAALGGELSTAVELDSRFRLRVTVPLEPAC